MSGKKEKPLCIAIVDDHLLFAEGLKVLIEEEQFGTCTIYQDGEEALRGIPFGSFDLVLVDLHLPRTSGFDLVKMLRQKVPKLRIVILTMDASRESFFEALSLGVQGYILKSSSFSKIANDLRTALQGDLVIGTEVVPYLLQGVQVPKSREEMERSLQILTEREKAVLRFLVQGKGNETIARELGLSEKTVKNYVSTILNKLGFEDRVKLVVFAIEEGFFKEEPGKKEEKL